MQRSASRSRSAALSAASASPSPPAPLKPPIAMPPPPPPLASCCRSRWWCRCRCRSAPGAGVPECRASQACPEFRAMPGVARNVRGRVVGDGDVDGRHRRRGAGRIVEPVSAPSLRTPPVVDVAGASPLGPVVLSVLSAAMLVEVAPPAGGVAAGRAVVVERRGVGRASDVGAALLAGRAVSLSTAALLEVEACCRCPHRRSGCLSLSAATLAPVSLSPRAAVRRSGCRC